MAAILQHGDYTVSGNDSTSSQKMAPPSRTDPLAHPRQLAPAASPATPRPIGSAPPGAARTRMASPPRMAAGSSVLGEGGAEPRWACGVRSARWPGPPPFTGGTSEGRALQPGGAKMPRGPPGRSAQPRPGARDRWTAGGPRCRRLSAPSEKWGADRSSLPSLHPGVRSSAG